MPDTEVSLRDTIEAAVEQEETNVIDIQAKEIDPAPPPTEAAPEDPKSPEQNVETQAQQGTKTPVAPPGIQAPVVEPVPKAWKPAAQKAWETLPPEVKAEVTRREREVTKVFGETNVMREQVKQFGELIRPFEARIQSVGFTPLQAVHELLKADHILVTAPSTQRAKFMAQLIKEYGVDIRELDNALAGQAPVDPVKSQLETMLAEKLSPLQSFLAQQQQIARQQDTQIQQDALATIDSMAQDQAKYPHFEQVRADMADVIEMNAKRQVYLTPEQAYQRAVAMNPEWGAQAVAQQQAGQRLSQAQAQNARAQKALNATASVSGAPGGSPVRGGSQADMTLRDTIEAAFSQVEGR
jgi:hypothetical protein